MWFDVYQMVPCSSLSAFRVLQHIVDAVATLEFGQESTGWELT